MLCKKHCVFSNSRLLIPNMAKGFQSFNLKSAKFSVQNNFFCENLEAWLFIRCLLLVAHSSLQIYLLLVTRCKFTHCSLLVANLLTARYSSQIYSLLLTRFIKRSLRDHSLQKFRCRSYCCKISLVAHYKTSSL